MTIHSVRNNSVNKEAHYSNSTISKSGFVDSSDNTRTVSKSLQSKAKNLLYTLSKPFRALIKLELHHRLGQREENSAALINIKILPMPRSTTNERKEEFASPPERGYTIVSEKGGYGKTSLLDRLWG